MKCKVGFWLGVLVTSFSLSGWWIAGVWNQKLLLNETREVVVTHGMGVRQILETSSFIRHPKVFKYLLVITGYQKHMKAGKYLAVPGMKASEFFNRIKRGEETYGRLKLLEGITFEQLLSVLKNTKGIIYDLEGLTDGEIMNRLGLEGINPEGRFAPDTYYYSDGVLASQILKTSYKLQVDRLNVLWENFNSKALYKCKYEWLIIASCLEKESSLFEEKKLIAGVILKRLKLGMKLQLDPTLIYGLGKDYKGKLTKKLILKKHSYNTYLFKGLPPTPICMPSEASLKAALEPEIKDYLYYVAKPEGGHYFSKDYAEHQKAIENYLKKGKK